MSPSVFAVVLAAAVMHASWNALVKSGGDPFCRLAIVNLTHTAVVFPFLPFVSIPAPEAWPWLLGSVVIHSAYYCFLAAGYRFGDLSHVYPIARGMAPPLVAVGGFLIVGESLSAVGIFAIMTVCAGIWILAFSGRAAGGTPLLMALGTGCMIGAYTISDGLGGRASGDVAGYIVWLFLLDGWPFSMVVFWLRRDSLVPSLRAAWRPAVGGGVMSLAAYSLVIWAMSTAPMAYVSALRETSVVFAALIGSLLLREPFGRLRVVSAGVVALGVLVLQLSR